MRFLVAAIIELTRGSLNKTAGFLGQLFLSKSNATIDFFHSQMRSACQLESVNRKFAHGDSMQEAR